jgi:hypothetical protein
MANNCWNYAVITGSSDRISQIKQDLERATEGFTKALFFESYKKLFYNGYFEYGDDVYEEFGSKWFEVTLEQFDHGELHISGDSAWSPVLALFEKMSKYYNVTIEAEYEECGSNIGGFFKVKSGKEINREELTYMQYVERRDPGRAFETMMDEVNEGIFKDFEDFKESNEIELLTEQQLEKIKEWYENN